KRRKWRTHWAESTDTSIRDGLPRSSDEAIVMIVERRGWVTNVRIGPTGNRMSPHIWTEGGSLQIGGTSRMSREAHVRSCERLWVKLPGPTRPASTALDGAQTEAYLGGATMT